MLHPIHNKIGRWFGSGSGTILLPGGKLTLFWLIFTFSSCVRSICFTKIASSLIWLVCGGVTKQITGGWACTGTRALGLTRIFSPKSLSSNPVAKLTTLTTLGPWVFFILKLGSGGHCIVSLYVAMSFSPSLSNSCWRASLLFLSRNRVHLLKFRLRFETSDSFCDSTVKIKSNFRLIFHPFHQF